MLYNGRFLSLCFFGMQLSVLLCILMNLKTQGYQPEEFVNDLFGTAYRYLNDRYNGRIIPNIYAQIGIVLNYTGVCIGGIVITTRKGLLGKLVVFILSFVPAALHMAIYADKGTLFLCAALFYGGVLLTRIHKGDTSLTNRQTNKVFLMCFVLLLPVLLASFMARGIDEGSNEEAVKKLLFYIASYAFGHLYAFSDWFSNLTYGNSMNTYFHQEHYTNGLFTFMSIFKTLGLPANVPDGYYDEYYNYRNIIQSNIYTVFRGAIQDFSFFGSYLYILLTGAVTNFAYHRVLTTRFPVISGAVFICTMGYIYSSFLISIMVWNSIFAVFVALVLLLSINKGLYKFSPYKIDTALATKHGLIKQGSAP